MAITKEHIERSVAILRESGATRILLFGSALDKPEKAKDLDLAYEGIPPEDFLKVLGRLLDELPILVDLVDLSDNSPVIDYIREHSKVIYE